MKDRHHRVDFSSSLVAINTTLSFFLFLLSGSSVSYVDAYPTGAGSCLSGPDAPAGHPDGSFKGKLEDSGGSYQFTIDGVDPNDTTVDLKIAPDKEHIFKIEASDGSTFRGFLMRISHPDGTTDVSGTLSNPKDDTDFQIMLSTGEEIGTFPEPGKCAPTVSGATHTERTDKTMVEVPFKLPAPPTKSEPPSIIYIEITVLAVFTEYYYTGYELAVDGQPPDQPGPPDQLCLAQDSQENCEAIVSTDGGCQWCEGIGPCKESADSCDEGGDDVGGGDEVTVGLKDCYNSTKDLLAAQIQDVEDDNTQEYKVYEICDGMQIDVGDPNEDFTDFSGGDYPIILARPNALIKCSGCKLKNGFIQLAAIPTLPAMVDLLTEPLPNINIDNTTVIGVTFSGELANNPSLNGVSAHLSAPGVVTLEGCTWKDFKGSGLVSISTVEGLVPTIEPKTVTVIVKSSTFIDVAYGAYVFECDYSQTMFVSGNKFADVEYDISWCGCTDGDFYFFDCRGEESVCSFDANCVSNTTFDAAMFGVQDTSMFELNNDTANSFVDVSPKNETQAKCQNGNQIFNVSQEECLDTASSDVDLCSSSDNLVCAALISESECTQPGCYWCEQELCRNSEQECPGQGRGNPCADLEGEQCTSKEGCLYCEDDGLCTSERGNSQCPAGSSSNTTDDCSSFENGDICQSNLDCRWCENDMSCKNNQDACSDGSTGVRGNPCAESTAQTQNECPGDCLWCMSKSECQKPSDHACFDDGVGNSTCQIYDAAPECDSSGDCKWCSEQGRCKGDEDTCEAPIGEAGLEFESNRAMFEVQDNGLGPTDPAAVSVALKYLFEVAEDDSIIDASFLDFANEDFATSQTVGLFFGADGVTAQRIRFEGSIDGVGTIEMDTFLMLEDGTVTNEDGEAWDVKKGDVKFNIKMSGWSFCDANNPCGGSDVTSQFVDVAVSIQGNSEDPEPSEMDSLTFDLGEGVPLILSNRIVVDGFGQDMYPGFPRAESTDGQGTVIYFRFPRFIESIEYDPIIAFHQSLISPTNAPVTPSPTQATAILEPATSAPSGGENSTSAPSSSPVEGGKSEEPSDDGGSAGAIVGGIVGGVLGLCCLCAVIGYFFKQRQGAEDEDDVNKAKTFEDSFNDEGGLLADQDDVEAGNIMEDEDEDDDEDDEEESDEDEEESDEDEEESDEDEEETDDDDEEEDSDEESGDDESDDFDDESSEE